MKNTIKMLGIIAMVAVIGFSMMACDTGNSGGGGGDTYKGEAYAITVNNFNTAFGTSVTDSVTLSFITGSYSELRPKCNNAWNNQESESGVQGRGTLADASVL